MHATDRVVLVGAGFGVWEGGRHVASARWADVTRVRAFEADEETSDVIWLSLELRDGTSVAVHAKLPGFAPFVAAAEHRLPGMRRRPSWWANVPPQPAGARREVVVFERRAPGL